MISRQPTRLSNLPPKIKTIGERVITLEASTKILYKSYRWQKFVENIKKKRGNKCEECGRDGCRIFGDHKIELFDGGEAFDEDNIKLLCGSCHTLKTNKERNKRIGAFE